MYYLYLCICTSAKCMSQCQSSWKFIFSYDHITSGFQCPSVYRQSTDCTEGGGLTREHCIWSRNYVLVILSINYAKFSKFMLFNIYNCIHANPLERLKAVRGLGLGGLPLPKNVFFRRMQNGALCCILDIQSVLSNL